MRKFTNYRFSLLAAFISVFFCNFVYAEKTLKQLENDEKIKNAINSIDAFQQQLDISLEKRNMDCQKAIGYSPFCECISEELPVAWGFSEYIAITTKSKQENGFNALSPELKRAYEKALVVRDSCVKKINKK